MSASFQQIKSKFEADIAFMKDDNDAIVSGSFKQSEHHSSTFIGLNSQTPLLPDQLDFLVSLLPDSLKIIGIKNRSSDCFFEVVAITEKEILSLKSQLKNFCKLHQLDWVCCSFPVPIKPGVIVFDLESTLVEQEYLDLIAENFLTIHQQSKIAEITAAAMSGTIDLVDSFANRLRLLQGIPYKALEQLANSPCLFSAEIQSSIDILRELSFDISVATGGFEPFANRVCSHLSISEYCCNHFTVEDGLLTGGQSHAIVDANYKAFWLNQQSQKNNPELGIKIAVGDGANDIEMMKLANFAVGYKPKPVVSDFTDMNIIHTDYSFLANMLLFAFRTDR